MNNPSRHAGQSTRDMAYKRYRNRVWLVLLTLGLALLILLIANNSKELGIGGSGILGLLILTRLIMNYGDTRARKMVKEERRAVRGAKGEEKVASLLECLGDEFLVIHDVASPFGNIDHIVISKQNAVYVIETKAHGGRITVENGRLLVNGRDPEKDFVAQAMNNTYWLRDKIQATVNTQVWIVPILTFTNAFVERTDPIKGVMIINKKYLLNILQRPDKKPQNLAIWENREKILKELCA